MAPALGLVLLAASVFGFVSLLTQLAVVAVVMHRRRSAPKPSPERPGFAPGISVLKPLCGADDELETNLACFEVLPYSGPLEIVLGVRSMEDPAYPIARRAVERSPDRFRLVLQRGEPGKNPKVNQLITLAEAARHELLVVSDSNVRAPLGYFEEIAQAFSDPQVGCISHPIAGVGEKSLGAYLDNVHLAACVGAGMIAAKAAAGKSLVVGKSMALRRADLEALGGFHSVKDVLAEDHVLGLRLEQELGKRIIISTNPIFNVSVQRSVRDFFKRYLRWGVIHRTAVSLKTYVAEGLLNPVPFALLAYLLHPRPETGALLGAAALLKALLDVLSLGLMRGGFSWSAMPTVLLKDLILFVCWANGFVSRTVNWRGNRLRVAAGSRLLPLHPEPALEAEELEEAA